MCMCMCARFIRVPMYTENQTLGKKPRNISTKAYQLYNEQKMKNDREKKNEKKINRLFTLSHVYIFIRIKREHVCFGKFRREWNENV